MLELSSNLTVSNTVWSQAIGRMNGKDIFICIAVIVEVVTAGESFLDKNISVIVIQTNLWQEGRIYSCRST